VDTPTSSGAVAAAYVLAAVAFLGWLVLLPGLDSLDGSEAAGDAMSQGFAALQAIGLWGVLALLALLCLAKGQFSKWASLAAVLLVPGSGVAAIAALELLARPDMSPYLWPIAALAAPPQLIVASCLWAITPPLRQRLPEKGRRDRRLGRRARAVAFRRRHAVGARRRLAEERSGARRVARRSRRDAGRRAAKALDRAARTRLL